jgi:hypothetical protein
MSDIKDGREPEIKVPSLEERLANIMSQRGVYKFNRATVAIGLPRGSVIYTNVASADNIRRYADAIGDFNPRFRDSDYAKVTKYGRLVAQPTFLASTAHHVDPQGHDEVTEGRLKGYHTAEARGFNSGNEWELFAVFTQYPSDDKTREFTCSGQVTASSVAILEPI